MNPIPSLFVSVGTTRFDDLVRVSTSPAFLQGLFEALGFEKVTVQHGASQPHPSSSESKFNSIKLICYDYKPTLKEDMAACSVVLCSGGAGTILEALEMDKIIVVVPNTTLQDNHQLEIVDELVESGFITSLSNSKVEDLDAQALLECISRALDAKRKRWGTPNADLYPILRISVEQAHGFPIDIQKSSETPLFFTTSEGSLQSWDIKAETVSQVVGGGEMPISNFKLNVMNNPNVLAASSQAGILLIDLRQRQSQGSCAATQKIAFAKQQITCLDVSANGFLLGVGTELFDYEAPILFFDIRGSPTMSPSSAFESVHSDDVTQIKFHPTQANVMLSGSTDGLINLYNLDEAMDEDEALYQVIRDQSVNKAGFFGPNSEYIYAASHIETLSLFTFQDSNKICSFGDIRGVDQSFSLEYIVDLDYQFDTGHLLLVAGSRSGSIGILTVTLNGLELVYTMNNGHQDIVRACLCWDPSTFISSSEDGSICVWKKNQET